MFIDRVKVHVAGGRGGDGVTAFSRQPYEPKGPPEGGDGGRGGSVVVTATEDLSTLVDYHHRPHRSAAAGRHGSGDLRTGAEGADVILPVPVGTLVRDADGSVLADLVTAGAGVVVARGGQGGRGNAAFRSGRHRAPRFHELGEPGQERWITLELKLSADVALVGFPNAGKSSLVARLSAAKPKIADYPYTSLSPTLGVVSVERGAAAGGVPDVIDFVVADVPGLAAGAAEGRGLGHEFLRHVERASVLVHVLDCASYERRDPTNDLAVVVDELRAYERSAELPAGMPALTRRPALVWLNKADADAALAEVAEDALTQAGWEVLVGSTVTGAGLGSLRHRLAGLVAESRAAGGREPPDGARRPVLRPAAGGGEVAVEPTDAGWLVHSERVERWVVMTDLANDEAVRHLQQRLVRAGVERRLAAAGAQPGDAVEIAGAVFTFDPEPADAPAAEPADAPAAEPADAPAAEPGGERPAW